MNCTLSCTENFYAVCGDAGSIAWCCRWVQQRKTYIPRVQKSHTSYISKLLENSITAAMILSPQKYFCFNPNQLHSVKPVIRHCWVFTAYLYPIADRIRNKIIVSLLPILVQHCRPSLTAWSYELWTLIVNFLVNIVWPAEVTATA